MSVVWIVEKVKPSAPSAAAALMGDYAVRVFASIPSCETVLRFSRRALPDVLVVDLEDADRPVDGVNAFVRERFGETPCVVLAPPGHTAQPGELPDGACLYHKPIDGLRLSVLLEFLQRGRQGAKSRSVVRFRDVMLDFERLQCLCSPDGEATSLPLKEAQILKLLLERPGVCLSRDEISASIWSGVKVTPRTIDSHVSRLRQRLRDADVTIESVYGGGYVLR